MVSCPIPRCGIRVGSLCPRVGCFGLRPCVRRIRSLVGQAPVSRHGFWSPIRPCLSLVDMS